MYAGGIIAAAGGLAGIVATAVRAVRNRRAREEKEYEDALATLSGKTIGVCILKGKSGELDSLHDPFVRELVLSEVVVMHAHPAAARHLLGPDPQWDDKVCDEPVDIVAVGETEEGEYRDWLRRRRLYKGVVVRFFAWPGHFIGVHDAEYVSRRGAQDLDGMVQDTCFELVDSLEAYDHARTAAMLRN